MTATGEPVSTTDATLVSLTFLPSGVVSLSVSHLLVAVLVGQACVVYMTSVGCPSILMLPAFCSATSLRTVPAIIAAFSPYLAALDLVDVDDDLLAAHAEVARDVLEVLHVL